MRTRQYLPHLIRLLVCCHLCRSTLHPCQGTQPTRSGILSGIAGQLFTNKSRVASTSQGFYLEEPHFLLLATSFPMPLVPHHRWQCQLGIKLTALLCLQPTVAHDGMLPCSQSCSKHQPAHSAA